MIGGVSFKFSSVHVVDDFLYVIEMKVHRWIIMISSKRLVTKAAKKHGDPGLGKYSCYEVSETNVYITISFE